MSILEKVQGVQALLLIGLSDEREKNWGSGCVKSEGYRDLSSEEDA